MENLNNKKKAHLPDFFNPLVNEYSSKEFQSFLIKENINGKIPKNLLKQNNDFINNIQKLSIEKIKNNSRKNNELKRFNTQKNLRRININTQNNNNNTLPEDYNIVFATKKNLYGINNGKLSLKNKPKLNMKNDEIAKKINKKYTDGINNYNRLNINYNSIYYKSNNNNLKMNNNGNNLLDNNLMTKKISNNLIDYNYDLNSTMPNKTLKNNYNTNKNNFLTSEKKLSINQNININRNYFFNDSFSLDPKNSNKRTENKLQNTRTMTNYKKKHRESRNDLSWDFGIGLLNKGHQMNFYQKNNANINHYKVPNYLSERKKMKNEIYIEKFNNDDIDDKDIDEIVDNLDLSFFEDEKKNNTVILNDKGFSDDSLSEIANDIIKTFQETENENINAKETVPASSNPDEDGTTSNTTDIQYNNNLQNHKNIIYITKSTIKPTIVNNFFISSNGTKNKNNNNNLQKDKSNNLFASNDYNNNVNSNIPSLLTRTYKSPNILREEKNNQNQKKLNSNEIKEIDDNFMENKKIEIDNLNNNFLNDPNILADSNQFNNVITPNINKKLFTNNQLNSNIYYTNKDLVIDNNENYELINNHYLKNNNQIFRLDSKNSFNNDIKNNSNEINLTEPNLAKLSYYKNFENNILFYKGIHNHDSNNDIDKLIKNKIKRGKNSLENNKLNNNFSFSKSNDNNYNKDINSRTNNLALINKNNYLNKNINISNKNYSIKNKSNNIQKNNFKDKRHISFNLNNNILIKFTKDDFITKSEITTQHGEILPQSEKDMNLYKNKLKFIKPKPIIKNFLKKDIKINKNYILIENLTEKQILPDLYDEFEEDDKKSIEKSLELSVDKIFH